MATNNGGRVSFLLDLSGSLIINKVIMVRFFFFPNRVVSKRLRACENLKMASKDNIT